MKDWFAYLDWKGMGNYEREYSPQKRDSMYLYKFISGLHQNDWKGMVQFPLEFFNHLVCRDNFPMIYCQSKILLFTNYRNTYLLSLLSKIIFIQMMALESSQEKNYGKRGGKKKKKDTATGCRCKSFVWQYFYIIRYCFYLILTPNEATLLAYKSLVICRFKQQKIWNGHRAISMMWLQVITYQNHEARSHCSHHPCICNLLELHFPVYHHTDPSKKKI